MSDSSESPEPKETKAAEIHTGSVPSGSTSAASGPSTVTLDDDSIPSSNELAISVADETENGKNRRLIKCKYCPSKILSPGSGEYYNCEFDLPEIGYKQPKSPSLGPSRPVIYEQLTHFWSVPDMYIFENIGFSNTVGQIKYLACADCEVGPIGYFDMNSKVSYVALARVIHDN